MVKAAGKPVAQQGPICFVAVMLVLTIGSCGSPGADTDAESRHNALFQAGFALTQKQKHQEAIRAYEKAIEVLPDHAKTAEAYNNLGWSFYSLGRYEEAIAAYQDALRLNPEYALAENNLQAARDALAQRVP